MVPASFRVSSQLVDGSRAFRGGIGGPHLDDTDTLATGLQRITVELLQHSLHDLCGDEVGLDAAVAHTLGALDGVRAALDLAAPEIGEDVLASELAVLDSAADRLLPAYRANRLVVRIDDIARRFDTVLRPGAFGEVRRMLAERATSERTALVEDRRSFESTVHALRRAQARYLAWPTADDELAAAYGRRPIAHAFDTVAPGLRATYRQGRRAHKAVTGGELHELGAWRTGSSRLGHQLAVLRPLWPEVLDAMASSVQQLTDHLAEHHDLVELEDAVRCGPQTDVAASALVALTTQRRAELLHAAGAAGARVYHEPTRRFLDRLAAYWDAWTVSR